MLNAAGFWRDEVASLTVAGWGWADIVGGRFGEVRNQPPGHTLLIRAGQSLSGWLPAEAAARWPFALAGALTCALLAAWGGRRFGAGAGLVGGLLLATSYGHLFQSAEARPYALLTLAALAALVALDRALAGGPRATQAWVGVVAAGLAGVASSYLMIYAVLPGLGLWAAGRLWPLVRAAILPLRGSGSVPIDAELRMRTTQARRRLRVPLLAAAALALGTLPALPELLRVQWAADRTGNTPAAAAIKLLLYNGLSFGPAPGTGWALGLVGLVAIGAVTAWRTGGAGRTALIGMATVAGVGLGALALAGSSELVAPRYWSSNYPFLCLLAGVGLVRLGRAVQAWRPGWGPWPALALGALALSGAPSVLAALAGGESPPGQSARPDYRTAARLLASLAQPGDGIGILSQPEHAWRVCDWYWRSATPLRPGVQVRDFADPRLDDNPAPPRIYWLIAADDPDVPADLAALPPSGLTVVGQAARLVILRADADTPQPFTARFAALATAIQARLPDAGLDRSLAVAQAGARATGGDWAGAAAWSRQAGRYRALGDEHLASAAGFLARGEPDRALIEITAARALDPGNPAIHATAAPLLDQAGDPRAAAAERRLAAALADLRPTPTPNATATH